MRISLERQTRTWQSARMPSAAPMPTPAAPRTRPEFQPSPNITNHIKPVAAPMPLPAKAQVLAVRQRASAWPLRMAHTALVHANGVATSSPTTAVASQPCQTSEIGLASASNATKAHIGPTAIAASKGERRGGVSFTPATSPPPPQPPPPRPPPTHSATSRHPCAPTSIVPRAAAGRGARRLCGGAARPAAG